MGLGLSKPERPLSVLVLACSAPALYTSFLRRLAVGPPPLTQTYANFLKAYGPPFFVAGHFLACQKKTQKDVPDWCYIAATVSLSLAGQAIYRGRKFPLGILLNGLFLFVFGVLNRQRAKAAWASTTLANLATAAGVSNTSLGVTLLALEAGAIKETPFVLTLPQHGQVTATLFGLANVIRFLQLLQQGAPKDNILIGQLLKVVASACLFIGNGLILGWQRVHVPGESAWNAAAALAIAAMAKPSRKAAALGDQQ